MAIYKDTSSDWLFFAESDLTAAKSMLRESVYHLACFHSQQVIEKCLKALLRHKGQIIPKTHSLLKLLNDAKISGKVEQSDVIFIDRFYIPTRYPETLPGSLPEGLPSKLDAEKSVEIAEKILDILKKEVKK